MYQDKAFEFAVVGLNEIKNINTTGTKIPIHVFSIPTEGIFRRCNRGTVDLFFPDRSLINSPAEL